jgi:hypothetical protein
MLAALRRHQADTMTAADRAMLQQGGVRPLAGGRNNAVSH